MTRQIGLLQRDPPPTDNELWNLVTLYGTLHSDLPPGEELISRIRTILTESFILVSTGGGADGRSIVGMATLTPLRTVHGAAGLVTDVAVLPAFRNEGRAHALLRSLRQLARQCGMQRVLASVPADKAEAKDICLRLGFTQERRDVYTLRP